MFKAIAKGYGAAVIIGFSGYLALGGPLWAWVLLVWIGGAPVTLFFTDPPDETADTPSSAVQDPGPLSWFGVSPGKTRADGGS